MNQITRALGSGRSTLLRQTAGPLQRRWFQHDFVPRDPNSKPRRFKYPDSYDPYGPRAPPSDRVLGLAERIASLSPEDRREVGPALARILTLPSLQRVSTEGLDLAGPAKAGEGAKKAEAEKTAFDVKLEKFEAAAKIKVIKEVRGFTSLGLKEAKELVEKAPTVLKQGVTKDEALLIIDKIKAAGGVATME